MYLLGFVAILPCLLAAEVKTILCPGGKECPFGKTCCELKKGDFECCDVPEDLLNQKLVSARPAISTMNESMALSFTQNVYCPGTLCSLNMCCPTVSNGVCCPNPQFCCEHGLRCCSNGYNLQPWCCKRSQRCHINGYCWGGAASVKAAILPLLFAFAMGIASKYLF